MASRYRATANESSHPAKMGWGLQHGTNPLQLGEDNLQVQKRRAADGSRQARHQYLAGHRGGQAV